MEREDILYEIRRCLRIEADSVKKQQEEIDEEVILKVAETIQNCKGKIILSACGTSAMAAKKIAHSLNCIERPALFLTPSDAVHGGLGVVQSEDVVILISKGGNTEELVRLLPACKIKKATVIGVSENPDSKLAVNTDIYLKIKVEREPCRFNMLATASTMAVIAVFDAVCIALMQMTGYSREQFAVIHPGGAVGERLLNEEKS
ncbi:MAG: SIS domain-containing protein [Lachnospiraceae bacterium]|nr:SIS domain-containing protein [Lachnospiraceae bacterium]